MLAANIFNQEQDPGDQDRRDAEVDIQVRAVGHQGASDEGDGTSN